MLRSHRPHYRGRFAPSPSGPLHFGSLVAALGSYLQARIQGGEWLVRIEDVDTPRTMPGASETILRDLERLGLGWDGPVLYQSQRASAYREALDFLIRAGWAYACGCSRRDLVAGVYPGTCRHGIPPGRAPRSLRLRTPLHRIGITDAVQGPFGQVLASAVGDFVIRRADGVCAYHLAVVVDDAEQGVTEVIRGSDLLDSTPRQVHLQRVLGLPTPAYGHLPVAANRSGQKLSKQNRAPAVCDADPVALLHGCLDFLGQQPPPELLEGSVEEVLRWALANWQLARVPGLMSRRVEPQSEAYSGGA